MAGAELRALTVPVQQATNLISEKCTGHSSKKNQGINFAVTELMTEILKLGHSCNVTYNSSPIWIKSTIAKV
jgi:hypothetical protein